jgi:hypothetical protein
MPKMDLLPAIAVFSSYAGQLKSGFFGAICAIAVAVADPASFHVDHAHDVAMGSKKLPISSHFVQPGTNSIARGSAHYT